MAPSTAQLNPDPFSTSFSITPEKQLILALEERDLAKLKILLQSGININQADEEGYTPLHVAVYSGEPFVRLLIEYGAQPKETQLEAISPLTLACITGKKDVAKLLLEKFPAYQQVLLTEQGPLHYAVRKQDRALAKEIFTLVEQAENKFNYTKLHKAAEWHELEMIQQLAKNDPRLNQKDNFGYTPLHLAVLNNDPTAVAILMNKGADPYCLTAKGQSAFDLANQQALAAVAHALGHADAHLPTINEKQLGELLANIWQAHPTYNSSSEQNKLVLSQILKENGFNTHLKDLDLSHLSFYLYNMNLDLAGIHFEHCLFNTRLNDFHFQGTFEDCSFKAFECNHCQFEPGTLIKNSSFQDSLFFGNQFQQTSFINNAFFHTGFVETNFVEVNLIQNHIYGSQFWDTTFTHVATQGLSFLNSEIKLLHEDRIYTTRDKPIIGLLGERMEIADFSQPGFMAAEPYARIKQAGALPVLLSLDYLESLVDIHELKKEVHEIINNLNGQPINESSNSLNGQPINESNNNLNGQPINESSNNLNGQPINGSINNLNGQPINGSIIQLVLHTEKEQIKKVNKIAADLAAKLDGIWIPGGPDIYEGFYGKQKPFNGFLGDYFMVEQLFEFALVDHLLAHGKPVLGVCHGAQLLNVYFGGTLLAHVDGHDGVVQPVEIIHNQGALGGAAHGSQVWGISAHHQAIDQLAEPLEVVAKYNGIIKAAQGKNQPAWLFQFHPEYLLDENNSRMLDSFFQAAKKNYQATPFTIPAAPLHLSDILLNENEVVFDRVSQPSSFPLGQESPMPILPTHEELHLQTQPIIV